MNIETKDIDEMAKNVDHIKKRYLNELTKILKAVDKEYDITYDKRIESLTGCKTIMKNLKNDDNEYINPALKDNLELILNIMKKTYIEDSIDFVIYKEIRKKLIEIINDINDIDLTNAINFTKKHYDEMIIQGIEEV